MLLDQLANRYSLLPSEVLTRADTLDLLVMDVAITWNNQKQAEAHAKATGAPKPAPAIPLNKLQAMMERVRGNAS